MIRTMILACYLAAVSAASAQIFTESFDQGIPASFTVYDRDGLVPNQSMAVLGFKTGKGWIEYSLKDEQGTFAASTSKYENPGSSDDWLVTPEITIPAKGIWLEWKAVSCSKTSKAGYKVLISENGTGIGSFSEAPVFQVEEEESTWTPHYVSLDRYEGKTIHVAFVNNSTDKYLLGIDEIVVSQPRRISIFESVTPQVVSDVPEFTLSGKIRANYAEAIHSFTASYQCGDKTETQEFAELNIKPGEEYEFSFDKKISTRPGDTVKYSIFVKIGNEEYAAEGMTVCYAFLPERVFVLEEATGTWCGYCPAGHVALDYMRETYPDEVIPIAVHNEDPMTVKIYDSGLYSLGIDGYPVGFINRKYKSQPMGRDMTPANGGWETAYLNAAGEPAPADLDLKVEYTNDGKDEVRFLVKAKFALNLSQAAYRIVYVVKECNVKGTTVKYNQNNSYSGSDKTVGGFEKLPVSVPASMMVYHDVARAIKPSFKGDLFVESAVKAGDELSSEYTLALPSTILNKDNLSFIVFLLDAKTGEIVNARSFRFNTHGHEGLATGMDSPTLDSEPKITAFYNGHGVEVIVNMNDASAVSAGIYDLNGICLSEKFVEDIKSGHVFSIPVHNRSGVFILKVQVGGEVYTRKIIK